MEDFKIIEIDGTSYKCESIIELNFTSLIKLLYKLAEKQKKLENKIDLVNNRVDEKENRLSNLEIQIKGESKSEDNKIIQSFQSSPKISEKKIPKNIEKFDISSKQNSVDDENDEKVEKDEKDEKDKKDEKGEKDEKNEKDERDERDVKEEDDETTININPDMIRKLFKRVKDNEKKISQLIKKTLEHNILDRKINENHDLISSNSQKIEDLQKTLNDLISKFSDFKSDYEDVKLKVQDFSIYDLIKGDGVTGENIDISKALVMSLENKIFKKFSYYDERYRNYDKDIIDIKNENKNISNLIEGIKRQLNQRRFQEENNINQNNINTEIKDLSINYEEELSQLKEKIKLIEKKLNKINIKNNEISSDNNSFDELIQQKMKEIEEKFINLIKKEINDKELRQKNEKNMKDEIESLKKEIKRINDIEKMVKESFDELNAKNIKERLQNLENENLKKFSKIDGNDLKNRIYALEEEMKNENLTSEQLRQTDDKIRGDLNNLGKKIEFLNNEFTKLSFQRITSSSEKPEINLDFIRFLEKNEYNENKKDVNNKFEKVRLAIENLGRNLENILNSMSQTINEKDFINYQGVIKNTIDELKLSLNKKYADKSETNKSLKYLETQIKSILESKKMEGADNWLLAKKPLSKFLCASCESVLKGELDNRSEYIPWNKYPSRDEKTYRMGHGFSRMLQMVNDDIMKNTNTDNINNDFFINVNSNNNNINNLNNFNISNTRDSLKIENNSNLNSPKHNDKLPKVKNRNLNTLESNLQINKSKDDVRIKTSPFGDHFLNKKGFDKPKIMKIYKLSKNSTLSNNNSESPDLNNTGFKSITKSQKNSNQNEISDYRFYNTVSKKSSQFK